VGQKVHPYGFRLGYNKDWHSHWFAKKQYGEFLIEDLKLKANLKARFTGAGVSHVDVERAANRLKIIIYTSRPGIIIGRKGAEIDKLKSDLSEKTGREVLVSIQEIHKPELNAQLQAEKIIAAANGQFLMIHREAYDTIGGHAKDCTPRGRKKVLVSGYCGATEQVWDWVK